MKSVQCFSTLQLMPFASRGSDCAQAIRIRMRIEMFNRNVRSKIRSHFSRKDCRSPENRRVDSTAIAPVTGVAHRYRSKWKPIICGALRINAISIAYQISMFAKPPFELGQAFVRRRPFSASLLGCRIRWLSNFPSTAKRLHLLDGELFSRADGSPGKRFHCVFCIFCGLSGSFSSISRS